MNKILVDVTRLLDRFMAGRLPTGVDRVSLAYVGHFAHQSQAVVRFARRSVVLTPAASAQLFKALLHPSPRFGWTVRKLVGPEYCNLLRRQDIAGKFLFNTGHTGLERLTYPARLRRMAVRPVFFIHDLIPISHPEYCRPGELEKHVLRMHNALEVASGIIANSQATLEELVDFAASAGQPMPPAVVAPLGAARLPQPSPARPLVEPYFVMLGTIEARKNHLLILQVWRRLVATLGERTPRLVIIGQRGWECENVVDLLERCPSLRGVVIELSSCTDADVATYLSHAQALLFPSFAEGYGMPLVEALLLGLPVIASDLPAFREIAGEVPEYVDPLDALGWLAKIVAYAAPGAPARTQQLARIEQFRAPTWDAHFELVDTFLETLT